MILSVGHSIHIPRRITSQKFMMKICMSKMVMHFMTFILSHIISYHLFSFHGSIQDYKIHMDMEIVKFALLLVFTLIWKTVV